MSFLESVDIESVVAGRSDWLDSTQVSQLAAYPLDCVDTEFPHHGRAIESAEGPERPQERSPIFYGCYDWHSAVHSHWALVRLCRLFADHPRRGEIVRSIDARVTPEHGRQERDHLEAHPSFERPYGWAWFLRLAAELHVWDDDHATEWRAALRPLEDLIVSRVESDVLTQDRPFRVATHKNTAFALAAVLDYARVTGNRSLEGAAVDTARRFYLEDTDYPVEYEPLGWDFVSPALAEADLMRRVLDPAGFRRWLDAFLPDLTTAPYDGILHPVADDPDDGVGLHLVGLDLSKAWCLAGIAESLGVDGSGEIFAESARRHAEGGLERAFTADYAGAHWLSSFVVYLVTRNDGEIGMAGKQGTPE